MEKVREGAVLEMDLSQELSDLEQMFTSQHSQKSPVKRAQIPHSFVKLLLYATPRPYKKYIPLGDTNTYSVTGLACSFVLHVLILCPTCMERLIGIKITRVE